MWCRFGSLWSSGFIILEEPILVCIRFLWPIYRLRHPLHYRGNHPSIPSILRTKPAFIVSHNDRPAIAEHWKLLTWPALLLTFTLNYLRWCGLSTTSVFGRGGTWRGAKPMGIPQISEESHRRQFSRRIAPCRRETSRLPISIESSSFSRSSGLFYLRFLIP